MNKNNPNIKPDWIERGELRRIQLKKEQQEKITSYRILNETVKKGKILFTGSSLMEQFPIYELMLDYGMDHVIYNRGIGGFTTADMLENMEEQVFGTKPSKIFINIGTNDFSSPEKSFKEELDTLLTNYENILKQIKMRLPQTEVYVMAYYPVNEISDESRPEWVKHLFINRNNKTIPIANAALEKLAQKMGYQFIDVNEGLTDKNGQLKAEYTIEGIHMHANGYRVVLENMKRYL